MSSVFLFATNIETSVSGPQVDMQLIHQAQTQKYTSSIIPAGSKHHIDSLLPHPSSCKVLCCLYIWKFNLQLYTKVQRWKTLVHNYRHAKNRKFQETENALIMVLTTTTVYIATREQNCILIHYLLVLLLQYMILLRLWAPPPRGGPTPCCK